MNAEFFSIVQEKPARTWASFEGCDTGLIAANQEANLAESISH
jgi:hypothetical protein